MFSRQNRIGIAIFSDTALNVSTYNVHTDKRELAVIADLHIEYPLEVGTILQGRPFHIARLKQYLIDACTQLTIKQQSTFLIGILGNTVQERLVVSDTPSSVMHPHPLFRLSKKTHIVESHYLFSLPGTRHLLYASAIPIDLLFQYKLLFTSLKLHLVNGVPPLNAMLTLAHKTNQLEHIKQLLTPLSLEAEELQINIEQIITDTLLQNAQKLVKWSNKSTNEKTILYSISIALISPELS
jgi:hypothetical protein